MPFAFIQDMPKELRLQIYEELFASTPFVLHPQHDGFIELRECACPIKTPYPTIGLILTCKTIYQETKPLFPQNTSIDFKDCEILGAPLNYEPKQYTINARGLPYDMIERIIEQAMRLPSDGRFCSRICMGMVFRCVVG